MELSPLVVQISSEDENAKPFAPVSGTSTLSSLGIARWAERVAVPFGAANATGSPLKHQLPCDELPLD